MIKRKFPGLFTPLKVGNAVFRNRIESAPMAFPDITPDGCLTPEAAAFYELRAKGGAASVVVSECIVHAETGKSHNINICMDNPNVLPGLATTASAIKRHGAIPVAELNHSGKYSGADNLDKSKNRENLRYGPSAETLDNGSVIHEMPNEMVKMLVDRFGKSAALAKKAGFEMIMIHGGHGWLLQQFFSPEHNRRMDEYGGSFENRARLMLEVIDAVRGAVGPGFPIELRVSADEYSEKGYGPEDCIRLCKLVEDKIDLLHVSTGSHEGCFDKTHQPMFVPRGGLTHFAKMVKEQITKIPVATIGALSDPYMMEELIARGEADVVVMGRQLLADPYWPQKALLGKDDEIVKCCRCFTCMGERMATGQRICALNPIIGREYESNFTPPPTSPKRVLVAGGGPGGMQAAITAAKRGHSVTLCEKEAELGGALRCERAVPFKQDLYAYVATKARELENAGVEVRCSTEVTPELCEKESPDVLIVAVGAEPILPPIPGMDGRNVIVANDLSDRAEEIGKRVVIMGAGLVGCETAIHLSNEGREVTIVEMRDAIAPDANGRHRPILLDLLNEVCTVRTGLRGTRVTDEGLYCENTEGTEEFFPADTVICAAGQRPRRNAAEALRDCAPQTVEIGDCVRPAMVTQAVFRGHYAGLDI